MAPKAPSPGLRPWYGRALLLACLCLAPALSCDAPTRYRLLAATIDGVPPYAEWLDPPPLPRREGRRMPEMRRRAEPAPLVTVRLDLPTGSAGFPETWEELTEALPEDADGEIDWMAAIREGLIAPTSAIPPAEPDEEPLRDEIPDLELGGEDDPDELVIFSHTAHSYWLSCENCHPSPFEERAGAMETDMDEIAEGEACGLCHNTVAFPDAGCGRCHPAEAE